MCPNKRMCHHSYFLFYSKPTLGINYSPEIRPLSLYHGSRSFFSWIDTRGGRICGAGRVSLPSRLRQRRCTPYIFSTTPTISAKCRHCGRMEELMTLADGGNPGSRLQTTDPLLSSNRSFENLISNTFVCKIPS